jgi:hypothetical protein
MEYDLQDSGVSDTFQAGATRDCRAGKGRFDLISPHGLKRLAVVYEKGAEKRGDRNWEGGVPVSRCLDSALRHITQYLAGERDEDHIAQAAWNLFAVMHFEAVKPEMQDLPAQRIT